MQNYREKTDEQLSARKRVFIYELSSVPMQFVVICAKGACLSNKEKYVKKLIIETIDLKINKMPIYCKTHNLNLTKNMCNSCDI